MGRAVTRGVILALLLVLLLAAGLRFHGLGREPLWSDETLSAEAAHLSVRQILTEAPAWEHNPPLYTLLLHAWIRPAGDSAVALRFLSAFFGVAAVLALFFVARELGGARLGLVSAFLVTVSPILLEYSQEARAYSLFVFLGAASYYYFIRLTLRGAGLGAALGYGLTTALVLYTHNHAMFLVLAQVGTVAVLAFLGTGVRKAWLGALGAAALAFVPWLPTVWAQSQIVSSWKVWWLPAPGLQHLLWVAYHFVGFLPDYPLAPETAPWIPSDGLFWPVHVPLMLLMGTLVVAGCLRQGRRQSNGPETGSHATAPAPGSLPVTVLLGLWLLVPVLVPFVLSHVTTPIFYPRFLIAAVPALSLLAARGVLVLARPGLAVAVLCLVIAGLQAPGISRYHTTPRKEQWDRVTRLLDDEGRRGDLIVLASEFIAKPMKYHYSGPLSGVAVDDFGDPANTAARLLPRMRGYQRLWFIDAHAGRETAARALQILVPSGPTAEYSFVKVKVALHEIPSRHGGGPTLEAD